MIKFTQFLRPNGQRKEIEISRGKDIEDMASELILDNCSFELELIPVGLVHIEVMAPPLETLEECSLASDLVIHGPELLKAIDKMIRSAYFNFQIRRDFGDDAPVFIVEE